MNQHYLQFSTKSFINDLLITSIPKEQIIYSATSNYYDADEHYMKGRWFGDIATEAYHAFECIYDNYRGRDKGKVVQYRVIKDELKLLTINNLNVYNHLCSYDNGPIKIMPLIFYLKDGVVQRRLNISSLYLAIFSNWFHSVFHKSEFDGYIYIHTDILNYHTEFMLISQDTSIEPTFTEYRWVPVYMRDYLLETKHGIYDGQKRLINLLRFPLCNQMHTVKIKYKMEIPYFFKTPNTDEFLWKEPVHSKLCHHFKMVACSMTAKYGQESVKRTIQEIYPIDTYSFQFKSFDK